MERKQLRTTILYCDILRKSKCDLKLFGTLSPCQFDKPVFERVSLLIQIYVGHDV